MTLVLPVEPAATHQRSWENGSPLIHARASRRRTSWGRDALATALASLGAVALDGATGTRVGGIHWLLAFSVLVFSGLRIGGALLPSRRRSVAEQAALVIAATAGSAAAVMLARLLLSPEPDVGGQTVRAVVVFAALLFAAGLVCNKAQLPAAPAPRAKRRAHGFDDGGSSVVSLRLRQPDVSLRLRQPDGISQREFVPARSGGAAPVEMMPRPAGTRPRSIAVETAVRPLKMSKNLRAEARSLRRFALLMDLAAVAVPSAVILVQVGITQAATLRVQAVLLFSIAAFALRARGRRARQLPLRSSVLDEVAKIVVATTNSATLLIAFVWIVNPGSAIAWGLVPLWAVSTASLIFAHLLFRARVLVLRRNGRSPANALIVGCDEVSRRVATRLSARGNLGVNVVGFLDSSRPADEHDAPAPWLGTLDDLDRVVRQHHVSHIIVGYAATSLERLQEAMRHARDLGVPVSVVPRLYEEMSSQLDIDHLGGIPLLHLSRSDPNSTGIHVKYAVDRMIAIIGLVLLSPLMALLAIAVRLTSPGPILYRQPRISRDGRQFNILKFRTMRVIDGPAQVSGEIFAATLLRGESPHAQVDRRTPLGRVLRKLSLDELPQLINVARGDMSLIGPRPEQASVVHNLEGEIHRYQDRHRVKCGITGWAQVNGLRGATSLDDRVEWDNYYIDNWSFWLELKTFLLTIPALILHRGAE